MNICCCTLAGTKACLTCPNNNFMQDYNNPIQTSIPTTIIEKFDEKGNLIERITKK